MKPIVKVLHVMNDFGRSKDQFLLRMATNADRRVRNGVLCVRSHCKAPAELEFVRTLSAAESIRSVVGRRVSSRMGTITSGLLEYLTVRSILRRYSPDIIHVQDGRFAGEKLNLIRKLSAPILTTFHGGDVNLATYSSLRFRQIQQVFSVSARCHFVSKFLLQQGLQLGLDPEKATALYLGTKVTDLTHRQHGRRDVIFACVANMVACKGHETLLLAFAQLLRSRPSCRLLLLGDGVLRPRVDWLIKSLGIEGSVDCLGEVQWPRIREILSSGVDVVVHPGCKADDGSEEALGLVLCEAAERGLPVISTRVGGIPEVVRDGVSGLLVEERSPKSLCRAMQALHDDEPLRQFMGANGRKQIESSFDAACQESVLADMYCALVDKS